MANRRSAVRRLPLFFVVVEIVLVVFLQPYFGLVVVLGIVVGLVTAQFKFIPGIDINLAHRIVGMANFNNSLVNVKIRNFKNQAIGVFILCAHDRLFLYRCHVYPRI